VGTLEGETIGSCVGKVEGDVDGSAASVGGAVPPPNRNTVGDTEGPLLGASVGGAVPPPKRNTVGLLVVGRTSVGIVEAG